jgi:predicted SpoU family rRNA methylase
LGNVKCEKNWEKTTRHVRAGGRQIHNTLHGICDGERDFKS